MNLDDIRKYCLKKNGKITEEFPFGEEVLVFKVFGKIFVLANIDSVPLQMNLKCDPERAIDLRERYDAIIPGWHMNKKMWNTVFIDGRLSEKLIYELIDHSYDEVIKKLSVKLQEKVIK
jgi:predicted DNA-binding protein (MmcQ/YjbR family)